MLNRCHERGHPLLDPDLKGNCLHLLPLSMMLGVGLSYMALICVYVFFSLVIWWKLSFFKNHEKMYFVRCFFCICWSDCMIFFSFILTRWCITLINLYILNYPCIPGTNSIWSWWMTMEELLNLVCQIFFFGVAEFGLPKF